MKNTNKRPLKILAGVVALALIAGMIFITNAFVGNPISAMAANKAIKQYVDQNYSDLDLEVEKARFDFKSTGYLARAESKTSIDTKFAIYYSKGKVQRDDYESYVLSMFNTLDRLSNEYSTIAVDILAKELGYVGNRTMVMYDKDAYNNGNSILELDMKFDKTLPIKADVTIQLDLTSSSLDDIAKIFMDAHKSFKENNCNFSTYGLIGENDGTSVMVYGVTPADIESGDLVKLLEQGKNNESTSGIGVQIKEKTN